MAKNYTLPETFNINTGTDGASYWNSPHNTSPSGYLPDGTYSVSEVYYDDNGTTWYMIDGYQTDFGGMVFLQANSGQFTFSTLNDKHANDAMLSSPDYQNYLDERVNEINQSNSQMANSALDETVSTQITTSSYGSSSMISALDENFVVGSDNQDFEYFIEKTRLTFGMPPQWTKYVDPRIKLSENMAVGRLYSKTIYTNPTILSLTPGDLKFVTDNDDLMDAFSSGDEGIITGALEAMQQNGQTTDSFFRFEDKWEEYCEYVTTLNKFLLIAMSVNDVRQDADMKPMKDRRPPAQMFTNSAAAVSAYKDISLIDVIGKGLLGGAMQLHWVNFAVSGDVQANDNFTTSDRATTIESLVNSNMSDIIRDVSFMTGGAIANEEALKSDIQNIMKDATDTLGSGVSGIISAAVDVLQGGRISFPHVIDDCTYGKTMSVPMRFVSPYGDSESRYLNVLLPYLLLMGFTLPRQLYGKYDMYTYPFVCKAACRGVFACDLGIISNLSVVRGGADNSEWTADGQPTAIDITLDITPLHSKLMQSSNDYLLIKNIALQHYIGSICGVELTLPTKDLIMETWQALTSGESNFLYSMARNTAGHLISKITNWAPLDFIKNTGIFSSLDE